MNFIFIPTLEHIALMKFISELWKEHDIRALLQEFSKTAEFFQVDKDLCFETIFERSWTEEKTKKWEVIVAKVIEKIPQDIMQSPLKDKVIGYIRPVGLQILRWMEYHLSCFCLNLKLPSEFCWTLEGIIDKKKTAEMLIGDENIHIVTRFKLACFYCIEYAILELWYKIPERNKKKYPVIGDPKKFSETVLLGFWRSFQERICKKKSLLIKGSEHSINSQKDNLKALRFAVIMANKAAIEYFLAKVSQEILQLLQVTSLVITKCNKTDLIISDPPREYYGEVLRFLLSQMNDEIQLEVLRGLFACDMLSLLFLWPWQTSFVEIASKLCRTFRENDQIIFAVVTMIFRKVKLGYKDYSYREMFDEIWQQLPNKCKNRVINSDFVVPIVTLLLAIRYRENIKLMFKHISIRERTGLITSKTAFNICDKMAEYEEWDLLKYFVEVCATSKDEMIKFKEQVIEHVSRESLNSKCDKISQVLDDLVCGFDKRKNVDENECSSTTKRLCKRNNICEEKYS